MLDNFEKQPETFKEAIEIARKRGYMSPLVSWEVTYSGFHLDEAKAASILLDVLSYGEHMSAVEITFPCGNSVRVGV